MKTRNITRCTMALLLTLAVPLAFAAPLHDAAKKGDVAEIRRLLDAGADVNAKREGQTGPCPLLLAILKNNADAVALLLEKNADPNAPPWGGYGGMLDAAIQKANLDIVKLLIQKGAKLDPDLNKKVFFVAKPDVLTFLLESGANPNAKDNDGVPLLFFYTGMAFQEPEHQAELVKILLDKGADVNAKDKEGNTALLHASSSPTLSLKNNRAEVVQLLLAKKADVNARDKDGKTPLMLAADWWADETLETITLLLKAKADVNAKDKKGDTVLTLVRSRNAMLAMVRPNNLRDAKAKELTQLLLNGASLAADAPKSLLFDAIIARDVDAVTTLLAKGADVNKPQKWDCNGSGLLFFKTSPLGCALNSDSKKDGDEEKRLQIIRLLLKKGAQVNAEEDGLSSFRTPFAAALGNEKLGVETLKLFLDYGGDVNVKAKFDDYALDVALERKSDGLEVLKLLLAKGADVNAKRKLGEPIFMAQVSRIMNPQNGDRCFEKLMLLLGAGADPAASERFGNRVIEQLTDALITAKNQRLPEFLATATTEQKVEMLTALEKQIAKAKVRAGNLNEEGRAALTKGKTVDAGSSRDHALQVRAYLDVLKEIKTILEGS